MRCTELYLLILLSSRVHHKLLLLSRLSSDLGFRFNSGFLGILGSVSVSWMAVSV